MRTVDAHVLLPEAATKKRPASIVIAKDTTPTASYCGELPSGDLLVIETPGYATPPGRLLRRSGSSYAIAAELPGVNAHAALSPDGRRLVAAGPLVQGEHASCLIIDLEEWRIERTLPLMRPFLWLDDTHLVAQSPKWKSTIEGGRAVRREERLVDPAVAGSAPGLMAETHGMVLVDLEQNTACLLLEGLLLDEEKTATLSADGKVLYTSTGYSRISAVRLSDGALLWQRPPVRIVTDGTTYRIAFDALRNRVLAAGIGDHDVLVLDAASGSEIMRDNISGRLRRAGLPDSSTFRSSAIRRDGLIVLGTEKGTLVEIWPDDRWDAHKVAGRAIEALAFVRGGDTLVVGGAEKNLRLVRYEA
jgi:hypothetical protein